MSSVGIGLPRTGVSTGRSRLRLSHGAAHHRSTGDVEVISLKFDESWAGMAQPCQERRCTPQREERAMTSWNITLTFKAVRAERRYAATCQELDVTARGGSPAEAIEAAVAKTIEHLNTLEQKGVRPQVFKTRGLALSSKAAGSVPSVKAQRGAVTESRALALNVITRTWRPVSGP